MFPLHNLFHQIFGTGLDLFMEFSTVTLLTVGLVSRIWTVLERHRGIAEEGDDDV